ncbi:MAG: D-alanyl-D-alanine carboxypeptidase family protein [Pseudomonadota bacterium]
MAFVKKIKCFLSLLAMMCVLISPAYAKISKRAELVVDVETGRILHSYAANQKRYPASVTKMMTLYLVFDAIEKGVIRPDTKMLMTKKIKSLGKRNGGITFAGVKAGQTITVKEAIYTLITKSANDVAILVSRTLAGSEQKFAKKMTQTARRLGMTRTNFTNPSGLPDRKQYTTARDMAVLGVRLMQKFPDYYKYFATKTARVKGYNLKNHNSMLKTYKGMDGFKTGYINMSGFNLVGSAKRGDKRLIAVVFGGKTARSRNKRMAQILNVGWKRVKNPKGYKKFLGISMPQFAKLETAYKPLDDNRSRKTMVASLTPKAPKIVKPVIQTSEAAFYRLTSDEKNTTKKSEAHSGWTNMNNNDAVAQIINEADNKAHIPDEHLASLLIHKASMTPIISEEDKVYQQEAQIKHISRASGARSTARMKNRWLVQVGAFAEQNTASAYITSLRGEYNGLAQAVAHLEPVTHGRNTVYRARFSGLTAKTARVTCAAMKRAGRQCMMISQGG